MYRGWGLGCGISGEGVWRIEGGVWDVVYGTFLCGGDSLLSKRWRGILVMTAICSRY